MFLWIDSNQDQEEISRQQRLFITPLYHWAAWASWSQNRCSQPCGGGTIQRHRQCLLRNNVQTADINCERYYFQQKATQWTRCNEQTCPAPHWSEWYTWSACSKSCGIGIRYRSKSCVKALPELHDCDGNHTQMQSCSHSCQTGPYWSSWQQWSHCSGSCGSGVKIRVRNCVPSTHGVNNCQGDAVEKQTCQHQSDCPFDGMWSSWGSWSSCSHSCGRGIHFRRRSCDNPAPSGGGKACYGDNTQTRGCTLPSCPVHGWSAWGIWSRCSGSCGSGIQLRVRSCSHPNSQLCKGQAMERRLCTHQRACPVSSTAATTTTKTTAATTPAKTSAATTTTAAKTSAATTRATPTSLPTISLQRISTVTTSTSTSVTGSCFDDAVCSDPKTRPVACKDPYIAASYCPKMCGICGSATGLSAPKCQDKAGIKCSNTVYQMFACSDRDLSHVCERTCRLCH